MLGDPPNHSVVGHRSSVRSQRCDDDGDVFKSDPEATQQLERGLAKQEDVCCDGRQEVTRAPTTDSAIMPQQPACISPQKIQGIERSRRLMAKILEKEVEISAICASPPIRLRGVDAGHPVKGS